jgi:hypothetical protein
VVLRGENVARYPAHIGAEFGKCFDKNSRLNGHVQAAHDLHSSQRFLCSIALPNRHQTRHFLLGKTDLFPAKLRQRQIFYLEGLTSRLPSFDKSVRVFDSSGHSSLLLIWVRYSISGADDLLSLANLHIARDLTNAQF